MKKVLMLAMALTLVSGVAMADHIGIYQDQAGTSCTYTPAGIEPLTMYVLHKFSAGSTASEFKFVDGTGLSTAPTFTAAAGMLVAGDGPYVDLSLGYSAGCLAGDFLLGTLGAFAFPFPSQACGEISIVAGGQQPYVKVVDCDFISGPATGGSFFLNPNGTCEGPCDPNAVEESTWGKVKSLYQ